VEAAVDRKSGRVSHVLGLEVSRSYRLLRVLNRWLISILWHVVVEGMERWPEAPFCLVANHHNAWDAQIVLAVTPQRPRITWFGPRTEDFSRGWDNKLVAWHGGVIPIHRDRFDLLSAVRAVRRVFASGGVLGIFPEGRAGYRESGLLPFQPGAVAFAVRAGVPIVPCAIIGANRLWLRARLKVRFGDPISTAGAAGDAVEIEERSRAALQALLPTEEPPLPERRPLELLLTTGLEGPIDRERRRVEQGL